MGILLTFGLIYGYGISADFPICQEGHVQYNPKVVWDGKIVGFLVMVTFMADL